MYNRCAVVVCGYSFINWELGTIKKKGPEGGVSRWDFRGAGWSGPEGTTQGLRGVGLKKKKEYEIRTESEVQQKTHTERTESEVEQKTHTERRGRKKKYGRNFICRFISCSTSDFLLKN